MKIRKNTKLKVKIYDQLQHCHNFFILFLFIKQLCWIYYKFLVTLIALSRTENGDDAQMTTRKEEFRKKIYIFLWSCFPFFCFPEGAVRKGAATLSLLHGWGEGRGRRDGRWRGKGRGDDRGGKVRLGFGREGNEDEESEGKCERW